MASVPRAAKRGDDVRVGEPAMQRGHVGAGHGEAGDATGVLGGHLRLEHLAALRLERGHEPFALADELGGDWRRLRYRVEALPADTRYVRVTLAETGGNTWTPQIGAVGIRYTP